MVERGGYRFIPGVSPHAAQRQEERWGSIWSRSTWLDVVLQIIDRRAVLVRAEPPPPKEPHTEIWLVTTPDGPVRVIWKPERALIATILGSTAHFNSAQHSRVVLRENRRAQVGRERGRDDWRQVFRRGFGDEAE